MGHLVVECTQSTYADVHVPTGTQLHTLPEFYWHVCVYVLFVYEEKCIYIPICLTGQKMTEERVKADTHLYVWEWLLHTLSCQCEKDSCRLLVLQPLILHLMGRGYKKGFFSFPPPPPVSIIGRRPKQSNYKLNIHLSLVALHKSVGEAGWKDFFFLFKSLYFISLPFHLLTPVNFYS